MKRALGEIWVLFNFALNDNSALIYTQGFIDDYLSKKGCYATGVRTANNLWTNVLYVCISIFSQRPHQNPSHCEGFCTTVNSPLRLTYEPSSSMNAFSHVLEVELGLTGLQNFALWSFASRDVRRTFHVPSVISVQCFSPERSPSYPILVEFVIAEMACVSRNILTVLLTVYGIPVQRSISKRDVSHPVY